MARLVVICFLVLFGSGVGLSQAASSGVDVIPFVSPDIVYAKKRDGLPKEIKARGTIIEAMTSGIYCGILATGGTLKIKLRKNPKGYPHEFLYVAVLCFAGDQAKGLLGKEVDLEVKKMTKPPYSFGVSWSAIDSKGIPYYLAKVDGVGGLLKKITPSK